MTERVVHNLSECFDSMRHLLHELGDDEWRAQSLCPEWDVFGVVTHLTAFEMQLAGWRPTADSPGLFEGAAAYAVTARDWPPAALLERFTAAIAARRAELAQMEDDDLAVECWTPIGTQRYDRFLELRVFDFWVHEQDIRVPLGRPGHLSGPAAEMALGEVRRNFGYIAGKRVGVPDGCSVTVHLTGPITGEVSAAVSDGRARVVNAPASPDASITTDSLTFMLLACGRIDPEAALSDGRVTRAGDLELSHRLATKLRFTI